jgi:hypothetical protein
VFCVTLSTIAPFPSGGSFICTPMTARWGLSRSGLLVLPTTATACTGLPSRWTMIVTGSPGDSA